MGPKMIRSLSMSSSKDNGTKSFNINQDNNFENVMNKIEYILKDKSDLTKEEENLFLFKESENDKEKLRNGGIIKIAFLGRYFNNNKFCQTYFLNEKSFEKIDVFCLQENDKIENLQENLINQNNTNNNTKSDNNNSNDNLNNEKSINKSNSFPFFSNLDNLDFISTYFTEFHKVPTFQKSFEFKTNFLSDDYENCIELDLPEMSILMEQLCLNDVVIYCTDKTNENILKEANFFEYLVKRSNLFKKCVLNNQFFIVLNNHIHDSSLYHYQNEEANKIFKRLNENLGLKFIYDLDIEKAYEEKIIYFSLFFNKVIQKKIKEEKEKNMCYINKKYTCKEFFKDENLSKIISKYFPKLESNLNFNLDFIQAKFKEVVKLKFRIENSKNFNTSNMQKKFGIYYQKFLKNENYFSYDLNRIKEFDKEFYDSIMNKIENKVNEIKQKITIKNCLRKLNEENSIVKINQNLLLEKKIFLEKRINESFDYIKKEIEKDVVYFLKKFSNFLEKIENISTMTKENKNFKMDRIFQNGRLNFIYEIFDMYGLKHYYTSITVEAVNIYNKYLKELYLNITKKLNLVHITFESLEKDVSLSYYDVVSDFESSNEIKLPKMNFNNLVKPEANKFFILLLFKIFSIRNIKYKPFFAFYNVTNLIGVFISIIFMIKGFQKYFKFQPKFRKILNNLFYSFLSMSFAYIFSFLLNKIYNRKSEKQFYKLINLIKNNIEFIKSQMMNYDNNIDVYRKKYHEKSLSVIEFLLNNKSGK